MYIWGRRNRLNASHPVWLSALCAYLLGLTICLLGLMGDAVGLK